MICLSNADKPSDYLALGSLALIWIIETVLGVLLLFNSSVE
jgi:hypothetical protein